MAVLLTHFKHIHCQEEHLRAGRKIRAVRVEVCAMLPLYYLSSEEYRRVGFISYSLQGDRMVCLI